MKVKWVLETGFNGCVHEGEIEVDDTASDDEIEEAAKEEAFSNLSLTWSVAWSTKIPSILPIVKWELDLGFPRCFLSDEIEIVDQNLSLDEIEEIVKDEAYSTIDWNWWKDESALADDTIKDNGEDYISSLCLQRYIQKNLRRNGCFSEDAENIMDFVIMNSKPVVNSGKWLRKGQYLSLVCSECNEVNNADKGSPFCPNCGAKMSNGDEVI